MGDGKALAHSYRKLQHWNQWLSQDFLGCNLITTEHQILARALSKHFGKHALLIGVPRQYHLLDATQIPCHTLLTPLIHHDKKIITVEGDLHELPIITGSIDLALLPHTLEFVDNPRQLLAEACRVIKPEGLLVICGFNPFSAWGAKKILTKKKQQPWVGNYLQMSKVKAWLKLADFELEQHKNFLFRPPLKQRGFYEGLSFLEKFGDKFAGFLGGAYVLSARAKVIPLTPIKMKWKQQLSGIRISPSITGQALGS